MAGNNYQLTVQVGPNPGKVYPLDKQEMVIGRDLTVEIVVNDPEVSRKHAHLTLQPEGYVIEDLGSTNGTIIAGERLTGPHLLRSGEEIALGEHVTLVYEGTQIDPGATQIATNSVPARAPATVIEPAPGPAFSDPYPEEQPVYPDFFEPPPQEPVQVQPEPAKKRFPTWAIVTIVAVLVLICACAAILEVIDANNLWCSLFPFIPGCP